MKEDNKRSGGSKQGEHVFNALGDLVSQFINELTRNINASAPDSSRSDAQKTISQLQEYATEFVRKRNNSDFRAGPQGDAANSHRYATFVDTTRTAIRDMLSGNPSRQTRGYSDLTKLLNNLDFYTIDTTAHDSVRAQLSAARQREFDTWYDETKALMHLTFKTLIDAALAVNKTNAN
ncbi:hypothetical protein BJP36_19740 [Moorena producens JHB]|uniref:Uncharacterized protein n=1 Tax=Moorena producens (strain JHB) TaxID=1454205 RepID=A0A1D9G2F6_MOOP1|nr:hypothetical protein [Moorena producens]AOY81812.1 hypothetical protein BJP36_19740 [Moorena producens JHB]